VSLSSVYLRSFGHEIQAQLVVQLQSQKQPISWYIHRNQPCSLALICEENHQQQTKDRLIQSYCQNLVLNSVQDFHGSLEHSERLAVSKSTPESRPTWFFAFWKFKIQVEMIEWNDDRLLHDMWYLLNVYTTYFIVFIFLNVKCDKKIRQMIDLKPTAYFVICIGLLQLFSLPAPGLLCFGLHTGQILLVKSQLNIFENSTDFMLIYKVEVFC